MENHIEKDFTQMALEGITDQSGNQVPSQNFDSIEAAIEWIKKF